MIHTLLHIILCLILILTGVMLLTIYTYLKQLEE